MDRFPTSTACIDCCQSEQHFICPVECERLAEEEGRIANNAAGFSHVGEPSTAAPDQAEPAAPRKRKAAAQRNAKPKPKRSKHTK